MERKLQALTSGGMEVGAGVGDINEEPLAADGGRTESTTIITTAATRPNAKIHRNKERWYHFTVTDLASATITDSSSFPSGASSACTVYIPFSAATRLLSRAPVYDPAEFGTPSSCLDSSFANSVVESFKLRADLYVRVGATLGEDDAGNAPGATL